MSTDMGYLATWYSVIREEDVLNDIPSKLLPKWQKGVAKAKKESHLKDKSSSPGPFYAIT
jgi:hypothetical protein